MKETVLPTNLDADSVAELITLLSHQATADILLKRWPEAEKASSEALRLMARIGLATYRPRELGNLAWAKAQQGRLTEACGLFEEGRRSLEKTLKTVEPSRMGSVQQRSAGDLYGWYAWSLWKRLRIDEAQAVLNAGRALGLRAQRGDRPRDEGTAVRKAIDSRPGTLFLQYALIDRRRTLLLVSSAHASTVGFELAWGTDELTRRMEDWSPGSAPQGIDTGEKAAARALGALLLGPVEKKGLLDPRRFPHVMVVGDGAIQEVPFAALVDGHGQRVVERFAVGYALALGLERPRPKTGSSSLLCVAYSGRAVDAGSAPGTLREARDVACLVRGSTLRLDGAAKASTVKGELGRFRVLLLASHGTSDPGDPLSSRLVLAPDQGGDGGLTAREVVALHLQADLAALTGCETGAGEYAGGDGLLGMAWAFQAAGCGSVVATGWRVRDEVSHDLVVDFFRGLKAGKGKDESLRAAALKTMRTPGRSHPYFWAGFKVIGDPSPIRF